VVRINHQKATAEDTVDYPNTYDTLRSLGVGVEAVKMEKIVKIEMMKNKRIPRWPKPTQ
jgi:hypothetical protein